VQNNLVFAASTASRSPPTRALIARSSSACPASISTAIAASSNLVFWKLATVVPNTFRPDTYRNASCSGVKMSRRIVPLPHQLDERGVGRAASLAHRLQPQA